MKSKLILGNCLVELKKLESNFVDAIITDPPYELGFMGKSWDKTGIANNVEMWRECLRVLKSGGHLLAFSGTRTYHRMVSAIEDAGFEVRDMIEWVYGSGFPKSLNIGKAVDKLQGNKREDLGKIDKLQSFGYEGNNVYGGDIDRQGKMEITKGTSEWEGWGTALKPAHEPICFARKPLSEKNIAENCLKWGTGGINIDISRVETTDNTAGKTSMTALGQNSGWNNHENKQVIAGGHELGRFPANLIHDNSEEVKECFPETCKAFASKRGADRNGDVYGKYNLCDTVRGHNDNGGNASRFFKSIIYQAKASKSERNRGCEELEEKISGTNVKGYVGDEIHDIKPRMVMNKNNHPTVKPIALMEYLINMVTREGQTVLDPFMGSGTTGLACKNSGRDFIGIELELDYFEIAKARM